MKTWSEKSSLLKNLLLDSEFLSIIPEQDIHAIFEKGTVLHKSVDFLFQRCGL
jgi:hypothetical protein